MNQYENMVGTSRLIYTKDATESAVDEAFAKLDEYDAKFEEFVTKAETMKMV